MTATSLRRPDPVPPERRPRRLIDMRCGAATRRASAEEGRCQLLAGHEGQHALMYGGASQRLVLTWTDGEDPAVATGDWRSRPWMRGFPFPAWFESGD